MILGRGRRGQEAELRKREVAFIKARASLSRVPLLFNEALKGVKM